MVLVGLDLQERSKIMGEFLKAVFAVVAGVWIYERFVKDRVEAPTVSEE